MGGCLSQEGNEAPEQIVRLKRSSQPQPVADAPRTSEFMAIESPRPNCGTPRYINAAYWPQWIAYHERLPSTFDLTKVSHIFYAFASINADGSLQCTDENIDIQLPIDGTNGCINAWTQLKTQYPNLKIILSVGGANASSRRFAFVGSHQQKRDRFAASAKHLLQLYNLDGIDINWDPESPEEGQNLLELVKTIRKAFNSPFAPRFIAAGPKHVITACLPASQRILGHVPLAALSKELDLLNLMAYNFVGSQSEETGHHAQLWEGTDQSCEIAVNYLKTNDVPPNKILLGVPLFGRSFLGADGPQQPFHETGGTNGIHEVRNLPRPGTQEIYEDHLGAVWCGSAHEFVSYDNHESVFDKAWFARDNGLAGLFYWHIGYDHAGERSLIRKGWETLNEMRAGHS